MNMKNLSTLLKISAILTVFAFADPEIPGDTNAVVNPVTPTKDSVSQALVENKPEIPEISFVDTIPAVDTTANDALEKTGFSNVDSAKDSVQQIPEKKEPVKPTVSFVDTIPAIDTTAKDTSANDSLKNVELSDVIEPEVVATVDSVASDTTMESLNKHCDANPDSLTKLGSPYANCYKEKRDKITFAEYDSLSRIKQDSILSATWHHGITFAGGRVYDKRSGHFAHDFNWGTNIGLYYFYRNYIGSHMGYQGRFGLLYRYSRFEDQFEHGTAKFENTDFALVNDQSTVYQNVAVDVPLTFKVGGFIDRTMFLFMSISAGVTKSMYEKISMANTISFKNPSPELAEKLEILESLNMYPYTNSHRTRGAFNGDDWETNSWIGAGLETKYFGINLQLLLAANSTSSNHRFENIFHKAVPTWRLMVDFSVR